jgi:hypothetical protein
MQRAPDFLGGYQVAGTPLISILIEHECLPAPHARESVSIKECKDQNDIETFIKVNASGRGWPLDHPVYEMMRRGLMNTMNLWIAQEAKKDFYVQVNSDEPSCLYYSALSGASIVNTEVKYVARQH